MTRPGVDYDETDIPAAYDRARDHGPAWLDLWMRTVHAAADGRRAVEAILDLGCGTGRFSTALASSFDADVVGLDPSTKMLARASAKSRGSRVRNVIGRGEDIPLSDDAVDLVFVSMVFHHFLAPKRVAEECRRVLRPDGIMFMRTGTADSASSYPYVSFIPASVPLLRDVLPSAADIRRVFEAAAFRTVEQGLIVQEITATLAAYADKLEAGGDSILARMDPGVVEAGLARLRAHAADVDPEPVNEPIDTFVFD
jgi:ubiquinone/menaquinone biosynthesis C-methylase UbiE